MEYRDRGSHRERKIKRKIGVGGRETGMGERERTISRDRGGRNTER